MRRNRSQTRKRRSHQGLAVQHVAKDEAGNLYLSHRVNPVTGKYRGRQIIDVVARAKRMERRAKRREKELKESGQVVERGNTNEPEKS